MAQGRQSTTAAAAAGPSTHQINSEDEQAVPSEADSDDDDDANEIEAEEGSDGSDVSDAEQTDLTLQEILDEGPDSQPVRSLRTRRIARQLCRC